MTTDELIAKLLDGTLTTSEQSQLQTMIAASPELAEEIRHLRAIEDMLTRRQNEPAHEAAPFLHSVEDKIAASLVAAGGTASVARMSTLPRAIVAPVLVLLGSIGVFFAVRPEAEPQQPVAAATHNELPPSFEMQVPQVAPRTAPAPEAVTRPARTTPARPASPQTAASTPVAEQTLHVQPSQEDASMTIKQPPVPASTLRAIEQNQADYDNAVNSGNTLKAIVPAYRLGMLYKQIGDARASSFLEKSLAFSRENKQQKYVAMSLGELSLMALNKGNTETANLYMNECLSLLEQLNDEKLLKEWRAKASR